MRTIEKLMRLLARLAGALAAGFGLLADSLGYGGARGIGLKQGALVVVGAAIVLLAGQDRRSVSAAAGRLRRWAGHSPVVLGPTRLALFAIAVGLGAGLCETVVLGIQRFGFDRFVRVGPYIVWLASPWNCAILIAVGTAL